MSGDQIGHTAPQRSRDDAERLARSAVERVALVARRAVRILTGLVAVAVTLGVVAYALGWWATADPWPVYAVLAAPIAAAPAVIAVVARGRVRAVMSGAPSLVADLRTAAADPDVHRRLLAIVRRSASSGVGWRRAGDLWRLRRDVLDRYDRSFALWASVLALSRLPWILAVTIAGCGVLAVFIAVALVMLAV